MQVINVKKFELRKLGYDDLEHWLAASPDHVYIGRSMIHYVKGAVGSKWANPFKVDKDGREGAIEKYEEHIRKTPELMESIGELDNKILGCWCYPEACHGDVLMKLLVEKSLRGNKAKKLPESGGGGDKKTDTVMKFRWQGK